METLDRSSYFGSSDVPALLGIDKRRTVVDLYLDKIDPRERPDTPATRRGKRLERYIADLVTEEYGLQYSARNARYTDARVSVFRAEVDAVTVDGVNIEFKSAFFGHQDWGPTDSDAVPIWYAAQVQWALGVTDRERCLLFALLGDDLRRYEIRRDQETIEAMRQRAWRFWTDNVVPRVRPSLEWDNPLTLATLRRLYPGTDGSRLIADDDADQWYSMMVDAQARAKRYQTVADAASAHLLDTMGSAALLVFSDGKGLRRREVKRAAYSVDATSYMDTRIINVKGDKQ